jgi:hypothetical protein
VHINTTGANSADNNVFILTPAWNVSYGAILRNVHAGLITQIVSVPKLAVLLELMVKITVVGDGS